MSIYAIRRTSATNGNSTGYQNWYWDRDEAMRSFQQHVEDYPQAVVEVYELDVEHLITSTITDAIDGENEEVTADRIAVHDGAARSVAKESAKEAADTLTKMLEREVTAHDQRSYRLAKEREEYKKDPAPDTKAILDRLDREQDACKLRIDALKLAITNI